MLGVSFSRGSGVEANGAYCSAELMENELVKSMKVIFPLFTRLQKQHQGGKKQVMLNVRYQDNTLVF